MLAMLLLKLYLEHKRNEDIMSKQLAVNERNAMFQCRCNQRILKVSSKSKPNALMFSNKIADRLIPRNIEVVNTNLRQY